MNNDRRARRGATLAGAMLISAAVTGCTVPSIHFGSDQLDLPRCTFTHDVAVADLDTAWASNCDLAGLTIVFPDGYTHSAPALGGESGSTTGGIGYSSPYTYGLANLGTNGVVAYIVPNAGGRTRWWGTSRGLSQYWAAFGRDAKPMVK